MLERDCLFLSGESGLTMKCVFRQERWMHTCSPSRLIIDNGKLRRDIYPREDLNAIIFYADMDNKLVELENLKNIKNSNIPCWPNIDSLIWMLSRTRMMWTLMQEKLCENIDIAMYENKCQVTREYPFVAKVGDTHRGQNKFLIGNDDDWRRFVWDGDAVFEQFYDGDSIRALVIGSDVFGIKIDNDRSWIKNTCGAEISTIQLSQEIIDHAKRCTKVFGIDVAGVDYIVESSGKFHILEVNQFPGLSNISDEIDACVEKFLCEKMYGLQNT